MYIGIYIYSVYCVQQMWPRSLFWLMCLLLMILYVFAILFTQVGAFECVCTHYSNNLRHPPVFLIIFCSFQCKSYVALRKY